jgi:adenylosuccinate synthase
LARQIILLAGPICSGKSSLCHALRDRFGASILKTRELLLEVDPTIKSERQTLQRAGDRLDRESNGTWIRDALTQIIKKLPDDALVVIDSVRIETQIEGVRAAFGHRVAHVHLHAPRRVLSERYARRDGEIKEVSTYEDVQKNKTEKNVGKLAALADVVIDTNQCQPLEVLVRAASALGLYGREYLRLVDVIVGGQYGSEGKGHIASYLAREYDVLVRVGGPNAGHTVYEVPEPYTFHHLPSGSRCNLDAQLVIGPGAVLYIPTLLKEIADCGIDAARLSIDPQAMIITEKDKADEERLQKEIGSTQQGVGAATARRILERFRPEQAARLARDYSDLRPFIRDTQEILERAFTDRKRIFLEGTQGTGLSLYHGHYPHVTSRDTTVAGCLAEAGISPSRIRKVIMVCRSYPIRVQNPDEKGCTSGHMSKEIDFGIISERSGIPKAELEKREITSTTKRKRRVSEFDWVLLRKAATLNAPTDVALTFADYFSQKNEQARRFEQLTEETLRFIEEVERVALAPVSLISTRFHSRSIIDRRAW